MSTQRHERNAVFEIPMRSRANVKEPDSREQIRLLKVLVAELHQQLESLVEVKTPSVEDGISFYDEVSRFEIELIKQALTLVNGHQFRAAKLLNLKTSTLGAKIKRYRISVG
jgi:transcriptional regulator with GAF, ATPase, and Fis domain